MRKLFIILILTLLVTVNVFAEVDSEQIKEAVITVAHVAVEGQYHPYNEGLRVMQEVLDQETSGKIKLKIYAGGSLSNSESEMLTMIKGGSLDMAIIAPSPISTYEPTISVLSLPYIFRNLDHVEEVMSGQVGLIFQEMVEKKGFAILSWWIGKGARSVNNSVRPIHKPDDLKGMKIRVMEDPAYIDAFKAFGAIPVPIAWGELHTALQTKTVDAHENDPQVIDEYGFIEFCPYFSLTEHTIMPIAVVISSDKLNSLGEEGKKIMIEAAEAARTAARAVADSTIEKAYQGIEEQGGFVNKVDNIEDFRNVVLPVIDNYKEKYGKEGAEIIELILE
ncbi:MAG: TRAP transporter substrate-binding protein [Caldisericia bacterium]|nr:TRAP transporter substrate-binding protein [Caldisericia bacterium]